jgi:hypothetical protein
LQTLPIQGWTSMKSLAPAARTSGRLASTATAGSACMLRTTRLGALPTLMSALAALAPASPRTGVALPRASKSVAAAMTIVLFTASPCAKAVHVATLEGDVARVVAAAGEPCSLARAIFSDADRSHGRWKPECRRRSV